MNSKTVNLLLGKLSARIGEGANLESNGAYMCETNVIRICAMADTFIKSSNYEEDMTGIFLPQGAIEYFNVEIGEIISVISGYINISSIK